MQQNDERLPEENEIADFTREWKEWGSIGEIKDSDLRQEYLEGIDLKNKTEEGKIKRKQIYN